MGPVLPPASLNIGSIEDGCIYCTYCVEIVGPVHIECAECKDQPPFCLQCFSCGAECGSHKKEHSYRVKNTGGVSLFSGSDPAPISDPQKPSTSFPQPTSGIVSSSWLHPWSSSEEMTLLDMVERYNLGNWEDVAGVVNARRKTQEVKEHYDQYYLRGKIGQATVPRIFALRPKVKDHTEPGQQPTPLLSSPPIKDTVCKLNPDDLRLLAYMPHRDDFEKEWNNDAESLVSGLLLMPDDDDLDKAVKLAQVDMYIREVGKRRKRKAISRDYDLVPQFFKQEKPMVTGKYWKCSVAEKLQMKSEKDMREKLRKFSQFMSAADFEELIGGVMKEKLLKERIEELQKYRRNGVKTLEEGRGFVEAQLKRARNTQAPISPATTPHESGSSTWTPREKPREQRKDSASMLEAEKPSVDGTECGDGKRNWQSPTDKHTLLSQTEKKFCGESSMNFGDYLMVKMAVFKDSVLKEEGVALRTNVRQDTVEYKESVKDFLKQSGWLPIFT